MSTLNRKHRLDHLASLPLFTGLTRRQLETIDHRATTLDLPPGFVITREGDDSKELVVVVDGEITIDHDGETIARVGPGEVVGELGVLGRHRRTATATVTSPSRVLHFDVRAVADVLDDLPELAQRLLPVVARRGADRDRRVVDATTRMLAPATRTPSEI